MLKIKYAIVCESMYESVGAAVQVGESCCQALCSMSLTHARDGRVE